MFASGGEDVNEVSSYLAALDAFPDRRVALIVGGHDRGIDYAPLAAAVTTREAPTYVLTLPDSGPRIRAQLEAAALSPVPPPALAQRHETGNSVRSNAMKPGSHSVEDAASPPALASRTGFAGVTDCPDLAAAVAAGYRWAQPDGIVLLSPAAPSFGVFKDYRDRSEAFAREVRALS